MKKIISLITLLAIVLPVFFTPSQAIAATISGKGFIIPPSSEYVYNEIGTLGGAWSYPVDLNDSNIVVGYSQNTNYQYRAFAWSPKTKAAVEVMPSIPQECSSFATAINNNNIIVGGYACPITSKVETAGGGVVPFVYNLNTRSEVILVIPEEYNSSDNYISISDINDKGQMTGNIFDVNTGVNVQIFWNTPESPKIMNSLFKGWSGGYIQSINNNCDMTGGVYDMQWELNKGFTYNCNGADNITIINTPDTFSLSPVQINDAGVIAGTQSQFLQNGVISEAVVISRGMTKKIPMPTDSASHRTWSSAMSINILGDVVGMYEDPSNTNYMSTYLYSNGVTRNISKITSGIPEKWSITNVTKINDKKNIIVSLTNSTSPSKGGILMRTVK